MRLGFDATSISATGKGISRFQEEFLRELALQGVERDVTVFITAETPRERLPDAGWNYTEVRAKPMVRWEQIGLPMAARRARTDVVVTTSERSALWGPRRIAYVFEHPRRRLRQQHKTGSTLRQRLVAGSTIALFELSMRRVDRILVGSQSTADDLRRFRRVEVVYPGIAERFRPDEQGAQRARNALDAPGGYFLHMASEDPRDNTEVVLEAFALIRDGKVPLVLGGNIRGVASALAASVGRLGIEEDVRWAGFRPEGELVDLYCGACAYVDPSLYEGFGFQAAEAMACGVPAITSDRTSLPEVVGDGGVCLGPYDVDGFSVAMRKMRDDPVAQAEISERARQRGASFAWSKTVNRVLQACHAVLSD